MLKPYLKEILREYDERAYRICGEDCRKIIAANAAMEQGEADQLDLRVSGLARRLMRLKLRAAGVKVPTNGLVVDLCCGTGYVARALVEAGEASRVVGIDLSRAQLRLFRRSVNADPVLRRRISILEADVAALPLADGSAAMIVGNSFLHHLIDVSLVLREAVRVLQPGGQLVVFHEPGITSTFFESFPLSLVKEIRNTNFTDLWLFDGAELERLLRGAGFEHASVLQTGMIGNVLLGAPSIVLRKVAPRFDAAHAILQWSKAWLYALEYKWSSKKAPSLLVTAQKAADPARTSAPAGWQG